ncbi:hypothetical protein BMF35_a2029 [Aurantiacibacter gangjinensis]|nr:hypothetical protein BMF35_a2029 [Aurantiacibacter gangjinensis]
MCGFRESRGVQKSSCRRRYGGRTCETCLSGCKGARFASAQKRHQPGYGPQGTYRHGGYSIASRHQPVIITEAEQSPPSVGRTHGCGSAVHLLASGERHRNHVARLCKFPLMSF